MKRRVFLTEAAGHDLEGLHAYVAEVTSLAAADRVLDRLMAVVESLSTSPERGAHPRELLELGIRSYRQIVLRPWRLVYRVDTRRVYILLIADGRRDMRRLLEQRLLGT